MKRWIIRSFFIGIMLVLLPACMHESPMNLEWTIFTTPALNGGISIDGALVNNSDNAVLIYEDLLFIRTSVGTGPSSQEFVSGLNDDGSELRPPRLFLLSPSGKNDSFPLYFIYRTHLGTLTAAESQALAGSVIKSTCHVVRRSYPNFYSTDSIELKSEIPFTTVEQSSDVAVLVGVAQQAEKGCGILVLDEHGTFKIVGPSWPPELVGKRLRLTGHWSKGERPRVPEGREVQSFGDSPVWTTSRIEIIN